MTGADQSLIVGNMNDQISCRACANYDPSCNACEGEAQLWKQLKFGRLTKYERGRRYYLHASLAGYNHAWQTDGWPVLLGKTLVIFRVKVIDRYTMVMGLFVPKGTCDDDDVGPSVEVDIEQANSEGTMIKYQTGTITAKAGETDLEVALGDGRAMLISDINHGKPFMLKIDT